jgi:5-methylcytosine-specific restriction endonuclease McrA
MSRRTYRRRRARSFAWGLALVFFVWVLVGGWLRWIAAGGALIALLTVPVLGRGSRSALGDLMFSSRQRRITQRQPYTNALGVEVRPKRPSVPGWQREVTYAADRYRCIWCRAKRGSVRADGTVVKLNLDHIKPYSLGFNLSLWNSATLCDRHNKDKSNYWQSESGKIYYRPFAHASSMGLAGQIARKEMRVRLYPWRLLRMGRAYWMRKGR